MTLVTHLMLYPFWRNINKYNMNKIVAILLILVLFPLFVITGFLVLISIGKPVLFKQLRIGRHGTKFEIIKFRTLKGPDNVVTTNSEYVNRSSRLSRLLRRLKLDELPQLLNVLRGDMDFFGPRPLIYDYYVHPQPKYRKIRLSVRPGIIGLSQVLGLDHTRARRRLASDFLFVKKVNFIFRIRILILLIKRLLSPVPDNPVDDLYLKRQAEDKNDRISR